MAKRIETLEEQREIYQRGYFSYAVTIVGLFVKDFLVVELITMVLIKLGKVKAFGVSILLGEAAFFVLLGIIYSEFGWRRLKKKLGMPKRS
ncbi:MAG TPA: hypothetical protein VK638_15855 [Edaphobacter sp.]|nr:hypothetical protein [Edaphobacter sp.]